MHRNLVFASSFAFLLLSACGGSVTPTTGSSEPPGAPLPAPGDEAPPAEATPRAPTKTAELGAPENVAVPFHILASNQSFDIDPVDIDLYVDGTHVVTGDFDVGSQHTWVSFDFTIAVGEHTLRAVSKKGGTEKTATFRIDAGERWAVVNFWYYATAQGGQEPTPPAFGIDLFDEQPRFQ